LSTHRNVAMPSNEDQLFFPAPLDQNVLQIHSVYSWHPHIHDDTRRPGVLVTRKKIGRRSKRFALVTGPPQQPRHTSSDRWVVIDQKHQAVRWGHGEGWPFTGRTNSNRAPPSSTFSAMIGPPCASTMERTIASPMPSPSVLVLKKGSNS